jgi:hypothetical protein
MIRRKHGTEYLLCLKKVPQVSKAVLPANRAPALFIYRLKIEAIFGFF